MNFAKRLRAFALAAVVSVGFMAGFSVPAAAAPMTETPYSAVDFTKVKITDAFWQSYQKMFILSGIPSGIARVSEWNHGMPNIMNMALKNRGEPYGRFAGPMYVDSDVHKVLESMCYALQIDPQGDPETIAGQDYIRDKLNEWIPYYQDAQMDDGYFDTYYTLDGGGGASNRWTNYNYHELYIAGHFYEAAVAHYRATNGQDTRLFDMAIRNADYMLDLFKPGNKQQAPGHEEIELALVKLADLCREIGAKDGVDYAAKADPYIQMAKRFLDARGHDWNDRLMPGGHGIYAQDDVPVQNASSAVGHAVRAGYLYTGMADVSIALDTDEYMTALLALAGDVEEAKTYVTGGIGVDGHGEGYGARFELPNTGSYSETCANIANVMWNKRMNMLFGDSKYADVIERGLYNSVISGVNMAGDRFFYENEMQSAGGISRFMWTDTACCPTNLMRTVMSVGQYVYTQRGREITTNLYIGNEGSFTVDGQPVKLTTQSGMPWSGEVSTVVSVAAPLTFTMRLRVPNWAKWDNSITLNGTVSIPAVPDAHGYVVVTRTWQNGDKVEIDFPMQPTRFYADPGVTTNYGLVAVTRGPIVYAAESADNAYALGRYILQPSVDFTTEWIRNLDGKDTDYFFKDVLAVKADATISTKDGETSAPLTMIPYYAWNNRGALPMTVYLSEIVPAPSGQLEMYATPSASYTYSGDSIDGLNDGKYTSEANKERWTAWNGTTNHPADEFVRYDFDEPVIIWGANISWYDDGGGVQIPSAMKISYWDGKDWVHVNPVRHVSAAAWSAQPEETAANFNAQTGVYNVFNKNAFTYYRFTPVFTTSIRLQLTPGPSEDTERAPGIREWQICGSLTEYPWERFAFPTASHVSDYDAITGLNDGVISEVTIGGKNAGRWTAYGKSQTPWVQYDFAEPIDVYACDVDWFIAPDRKVNVPNGLVIQYWNGTAFVPVTPAAPFDTFLGMQYNRYEFDTVTTTKLRMIIDNTRNSGTDITTYPGIREWRVIGAPSERYPLEMFGVPGASHVYSGNKVSGLNDGIVASEHGGNIFKWSSWSQSLTPTVWYSFDTPVVIDGCDIVWSDDGGGVQLPASMEIQYFYGDEFKGAVIPTNAHDVFTKDVFNTYTFEPILATKIQLALTGRGASLPNGTVGIQEWKVSGHKALPVMSSAATEYGVAYDSFNTAMFAPVTTDKIRMLTNSATPVGLVELRVKTADGTYAEQSASSVAASYTCTPYATLSAVNDGVVSPTSLYGGSTWSTWAGNQTDPSVGWGEHWIEYDFAEPKTFVVMEAFWYRAWDDGVIRPDGWKVQYFADGQWKDVPDIDRVDGFDSDIYEYTARLTAGSDVPNIGMYSDYDFVRIAYETADAMPGTTKVSVSPKYAFDLYAPSKAYTFKFIEEGVTLSAAEKDGSVKAVLSNASGQGVTGTLIVAFYDEDGRLISVDFDSVDLADGSEQPLVAVFPASGTSGAYKAFAWSDDGTPLCAAVGEKIAAGTNNIAN
ncbi:MAG: glycoside hydrolase family 127 protein [Oscillospiraceae bacterium]|jgi:DUF1680 family protein|nr:glycoside hydrolase family 127 protein [Oscillospiraceae bacterium]